MTGAATTHFTWLEKESDIHTKLCEWSRGKLQMLAQRLYTPVCLHMRAGLAVIALPELTQLFINYRLAALSTREAGELADTLLSELLLKPATSAIHV